MLNFKSKVTIKILGYYFINPNRKHYINELAKIIAVDPGNLFRKLRELEDEGLLLSETVGNQRFFYLNVKWPLLKEYKNIFQLKFGLPEMLKEKLKKVEGLKEAYIFGSYAKGNFEESSDIDVLLVGDNDHGEVFRIFNPIEKMLGREINVVDYSVKEFAEKLKNGDDFITQVLSGKVIKLI